MKKSTIGLIIGISSIVGLLCFGFYMDCHPTLLVKNAHAYDMESRYHDNRAVANIKRGDYIAAKKHLELKKQYKDIADSLYLVEREDMYIEYMRIHHIEDSLLHN